MKNSIKSVFTRPAANRGVTVPLKLPGMAEAASLTLLGVDSDAFREARAERSRESARILGLPEEEREAATVAADVALLAVTVVDWSFAEECSYDNVTQLLTEAPAVRDFVDNKVADRSLFIGAPS